MTVIRFSKNCQLLGIFENNNCFSYTFWLKKNSCNIWIISLILSASLDTLWTFRCAMIRERKLFDEEIPVCMRITWNILPNKFKSILIWCDVKRCFKVRFLCLMLCTWDLQSYLTRHLGLIDFLVEKPQASK